MAVNSNSYPAVVLLDNENNPFTPLVDISSIYADIKTKEDAGVLAGIPQTEDVTDKIVFGDDGFSDEELDDELYILTGVRTKDKRRLLFRKVSATTLFALYNNAGLWDELLDKDGEQLIDNQSEYLYAKKQ